MCNFACYLAQIILQTMLKCTVSRLRTYLQMEILQTIPSGKLRALDMPVSCSLTSRPSVTKWPGASWHSGTTSYAHNSEPT
ncbi:hypothetical protein FKM82_001792 [Ascaphus truei]